MARLLSVLIIATALLLPGAAPASRGGMTATLESNLAEQQKRIKQVEKAMAKKRDLLRDSRAHEINLMVQVEKIDQAIGSSRGRLSKLTREAATNRAEISRRNEELESLTAAHEAARAHVKKRLAAFYRMGEVGWLNVVFSATNLTDLLNCDVSFRLLLEQDRKTIGNYQQQITNLTKLRDDLARQTAQLQGIISDSEQQAKNLADNRSKRLQLLTSINKEKRLYQQALTEMAEAADNLNQTMTLLREKLAVGKKDQSSKQPASGRPMTMPTGGGFAAMKGRLPPPVKGTVTTYFGTNNPGKFGIATRSEGIDIKTLAGTEISAIHQGKVVYVGQLRGYGNLLIIGHGQQYYSLVSRAAEFYKKEGAMVAAGEVIGIMSDQGGLLGEGLHFEIRHGAKSQDPMDWLNRALLRNTQPPSAPKANRKGR